MEIKDFIPPILIKALKRKSFKGVYPTWKEAQKKCTGYNDYAILEKVKKSLLEVKEGRAVYERDSVLFEQIEYSWPVLATLQKVAIENDNHLRIVDFGGSLGSSYYQNRSFLGGKIKISWNIVEQEIFVKCGKEHFENNELRFYYDIDECFEKVKCDAILLSSVLPYIEGFQALINNIINFPFQYIIIDRTYFIDSAKHYLSVQYVHPSIYNASYPAWFFNFDSFIQLFKQGYELAFTFDSYLDSVNSLNGKNASEKGMILKKI